MIQKELLKLQVEDLVPYENNPRVISPEAVNACAESMRQCTALDPIEVDENNVILSGHTRRLALMQLHVDMADMLLTDPPYNVNYGAVRDVSEAVKKAQKNGWPAHTE